jgi:GT2 family glycosyltransferase
MLTGERCVYVDSGSTDGSVALARKLGIEVVELDASQPFTAARGRNAGFARLLELWPDTRFIQFVDGDCQLDPEWIDTGLAAMAGKGGMAVVFGRRRERYPFRTVFNFVCDREWDGPPGLARTCGGDVLVRVEAVLSVGGYDASLIAGEDDDFCHRLRRHGWTIVRLPNEMTMHDVAMTTWQQWWQRSRRTGHALAEVWKRHGDEDPSLGRRLLSNVFWALPPLWLLWPVLWWRVYRRTDEIYATHIVLGKVPQFYGQLGFWWAGLRARKLKLIEYK